MFAEIFTEISKKKAFLDVLLDISEQDDNAFSTNDVREEVDTFLLGVSYPHYGFQLLLFLIVIPEGEGMNLEWSVQ